MNSKKNARRVAGKVRRMVRKFRMLRLKEKVKQGDQFYMYSDPRRWRPVRKWETYKINHFGGVPNHYLGRFRRAVPNAGGESRNPAAERTA